MGYKKHLVLCFFYLLAVIRDSTNGLETRIHNIYKQIDLNTNKESKCICLENDPSLPTMPKLLDPNKQGLERLIIFLYKDSTGNIQLYIPGAEKQAIIPDLHIEPSDISTQVTDYVSVVSLFTYVDRIINIHPFKTNGENVNEDEVKWPKNHDDFPLLETTGFASDVAVPHFPGPEESEEPGEQLYENSLNINELQPIPKLSDNTNYHRHKTTDNSITHSPKADDQENSHPVYTYLPKVDFFGGQDLDSSGIKTLNDDLPPGIDSDAAIEPTLENDQSSEMDPASEQALVYDQPFYSDYDPLSEQNIHKSYSSHTELDLSSETLDYMPPNTDSDAAGEQNVSNAQPFRVDLDHPNQEINNHSQSVIDFDPANDQNSDYAQPTTYLEPASGQNFDHGQPPGLGLPSEVIDHAQPGIDLDPVGEQTFDYVQPNMEIDAAGEQNFEHGQPPDLNPVSEETLDNGQLPIKDLDPLSKPTVNDAPPPNSDMGTPSLELYDDEVSDNQAIEPVSEETTHGTTEEMNPMISDLTFSQWFATQMKNMETKTSLINRPLDIKSIQILIKKSLMEHGLYISGDGKLTDFKGRIINMSNLHIRPLLIGETVEYDKLVASQYSNFVLPKNLQYFESLLITLLYPPKIIGIIPMGKLYLPTRSTQATSMQTNVHSEYPDLRNYYYRNNIVKYTSPIKTKSKRIQISLMKKSPQNKYIKELEGQNFIKTYLDRARNFYQKPIANEENVILDADNKKHNEIDSQYIEQRWLDSDEEFSLRYNNGRPKKKMGKHAPPNTYRTSEPQELHIGTERSHEALRNGNNVEPEEAPTEKTGRLFKLLKLLKDKIEIPKKEGQEDLDDHEIRIIGGSAATGSGMPINSRGRSGLPHHG